MALSFVIRKAVSLSPKVVAPIAIPASNALRTMSTLGGCISEAIEVSPLQQAKNQFGGQPDQPLFVPPQHQDHPDDSDDPAAIKRSLRRASNKLASNKKHFNDLNLKKSIYNNPVSVKLDGFSIQEIPSSTTLMLTRHDSDERIEVEVDMFDFESKDQDNLPQPVPMTVNVIREHATNQFRIFLNRKGIRIDTMMLVSTTSTDDADPEEDYAIVNYHDLDDLWQKRLLDYLEVRGIRLDLAVYLDDYLNHKKRMENTWLWKSRFIDFFLKPEKSSDDQ